ncbi:putative protocadherin Fat 4 [Apostichopus japonicus]|uniref:Putative protocadherin Fat 4 n=1 Tax=Stichopus japonicus TaxID=307972 RepID=A0A2G8KVE1_STIJA|nr:putative protocadherin Fat 4 [Apostichopus japonicus]
MCRTRGSGDVSICDRRRPRPEQFDIILYRSGEHRGVFRMDSDSGDLYLAKLLDHETKAEYHLNVSAQDSGSPTLTSFASVVVRVRDCNDNAPTFSQVNIVKEIEEGLVPGTEVATVLAQDFDSGINGRVSHSILSQRPDFDFFQINEATGVISIQTPIDLESLPESSEGVVTVIVQAIDQALPVSSRQTATASVTFSIRDVNDNPPEIVSQSAAAVSPGASEGTQVTTVVATDIDSGDNADLRYSLMTSQVPFSIHPTSGVLTVSGRLDSSLSPYSLVVRVQDGGSPPLSSQSTLSVIVTEAQSTGPEFSQDLYSGQIQEGQPTGSPIVTVSASYSNGQAAVVRYYITSIAMGGVQTRNYFSIDASSGIISTSLHIDRESFAQEPNFALTVTAADVGSVPSKTRSVQVSKPLLLLSMKISNHENGYKLHFAL